AVWSKLPHHTAHRAVAREQHEAVVAVLQHPRRVEVRRVVHGNALVDFERAGRLHAVREVSRGHDPHLMTERSESGAHVKAINSERDVGVARENAAVKEDAHGGASPLYHPCRPDGGRVDDGPCDLSSLAPVTSVW